MIPRGLYGVADATYGDPWPQVVLLAALDVGIIQLRCKGWTTEARTALAIRAVAMGGPLIVVNDDAEAAARAGAWVHLGQDDGETSLPHGRSTHTLAHVRAASANYLGFGPVFATTTKQAAYPPRGGDLLAEAVRTSAAPVVAIGGIHPGNIDVVRATGVHAWAVIGAIWTSPDPRAVIAALR